MGMILHTCRKKTGTITVNKVITDYPNDATWFHVKLTQQGVSEPFVFEGEFNQENPAVFKNVPFGTYTVEETAVDGYTNGTVGDVTVSRSDKNGTVNVINAVVSPLALEIAFDDIENVPVADASNISDWNTFFGLPANGTAFTSVEVVGSVVKLYGGSDISISNTLFAGNTYIIGI